MACMRNGLVPGRLLGNGRFVTISPLNHGSFGMVLLANDTLTGNDVAIKCIPKPEATLDSAACPASLATDDRSEELSIHARLAAHPSIVNLVTDFETDNHQYMVLELCTNGDLYEAIRAGRGPLETGNVRDFMLQLVDAVDYMHSKGVYHRDIKPENIFLTSTGSMKLGDFGLATTEIWSTEFSVGSDRYMAPEQFDASLYYGYGYSPAAADVWAIGIVLLNLLFQRNPFATPTESDPLFADFAHDRQSLFDIFPNMSQDTFNVLVHSLALDPANRSLAAVKDALMAVVSFTTEDESLDDFCTEQVDFTPLATAAREPLRTPSVTSPPIPSDSFPWPSSMLKTPPKTSRQLSTILDEDIELFPQEWQYVDADEMSLNSNVDSGLGMSYKSVKSFDLKPLKSKGKTSFVGSLPISFTKPSFKSPYGASGFSKSWSDLWDEEMEQENVMVEEPTETVDSVGNTEPSTPHLSIVREDSRGAVTPRQGLMDMDVNTAPFFQSIAVEQPPAELPKVRSSSILDKWAALGNFRRARPEGTVYTAAATPAKITTKNTFGNFTPFSSSAKKDKSPSRERAPSWRQNNEHRLRAINTSSRVWQDDNNWRAHKSFKASPSPPLSALRHAQSQILRSTTDFNLLDADSDDGNQWDGNFRNFHL